MATPDEIAEQMERSETVVVGPDGNVQNPDETDGEGTQVKESRWF